MNVRPSFLYLESGECAGFRLFNAKSNFRCNETPTIVSAIRFVNLVGKAEISACHLS